MKSIVDLDNNYSQFFSTPLRSSAFTYSKLKKDIKKYNKNLPDTKLNNFLQNKLKNDDNYIRYSRNFYIHKSTKSFDQILDTMFDGNNGYVSTGYSLGRKYGAFNQDITKSSYIINTALTSKSNIKYIKHLFLPISDSIDLHFVDIKGQDAWNAYKLLNAAKWIGVDKLALMGSFMADHHISFDWFSTDFIKTVNGLADSLDDDIVRDIVDKNIHYKLLVLGSNNG